MNGTITAGLDLRPAGPADADAILGLAKRAYARWVPVMGRLPRPAVEDYGEMLKDHRIDLLEAGGQLVASIATRRHEAFLFIESIAVAPERQGQGIGKALLAYAETLALESGLSEIRLLTNAKMAANAALYQRQGYRLYETEAHPTYGSILHFSKVLA